MPTDDKAKADRKSISKSLRFEVFKRDSFKCCYCGAEAPKAVLHVDHIEAVANGGTNDITNLVTACADCNLGKSDKPLSENAAVAKSRAQLDELQERSEQLELIMQWRKGLRGLADDRVNKLAEYWNAYIRGHHLNDVGNRALAKLLRLYSIDDICAAMDAAANQYLKFDQSGYPTSESCNLAFNRVGGICRMNRAAEENPDIPQLFYIRGILRNRIPGYFKPYVAMDYLKDARKCGVTIAELTDMAKSVHNWSQFRAAIEALIDDAAGSDA